MDKIEELLTCGVANIIPSRDKLKELLTTDKKLNVYFGIDPTATRIHLGHAVPLRVLQKFSDLGHNVTFLIGDFTALIGDTSDKDTERPVLTTEQIEKNFQTYRDQAEKILDFSNIKVRYNSEWLDNLSSRDFIKLAQQFSFGDFASRELVKKRLSSSKYVGLHEGLYPAMQGYDSYFLDTDVQIGGTDQTFNMQAGRILQKNWRDKESYVLATEFLLGTDGRKMSKTWNNAIWLEDNPNEMYVKIMAINDDLIIPYFTLATNLALTAIENIKSELDRGGSLLNAKKELARQIIKELHGEKDAEDAENNFTKTPEAQIVTVGHEKASLIDALIYTNLAQSKSDAKRLIEQGGVSIDGKVKSDPSEILDLEKEKVIKVGKFKSAKLKSS
ncbi:MAG: tyrosine--tRNA ligase [Patescibacteria group bacterium]